MNPWLWPPWKFPLPQRAPEGSHRQPDLPDGEEEAVVVDVVVAVSGEVVVGRVEEIEVEVDEVVGAEDAPAVSSVGGVGDKVAGEEADGVDEVMDVADELEVDTTAATVEAASEEPAALASPVIATTS